MRQIVSIASLSLALSVPAAAMEMPLRKPGLWEIKKTVAIQGIPLETVQHCVDAETDHLLGATGEPGAMVKALCSKHEVQKSGSTLIVNSVCEIRPGTTTTTRTTITGSLDSSYVAKLASEVVSTRSQQGADAGRTVQINVTVEGKWIGACKADQKPGDMIMGPDPGIKINIRDLPADPRAILNSGAAPPPPRR